MHGPLDPLQWKNLKFSSDALYFFLTIADMFLHLKESTCCKWIWLNMICKGTKFCIEGLTADNAYCIIAKAMRSKKLPAELRDRFILRHRSGEGYEKNSSTLKFLKTTVSSIILKWKKFSKTRTLPKAFWQIKLGEMTKNLWVTLTELQRFYVQMGQSSRRETITAFLHRSGNLWQSD